MLLWRYWRAGWALTTSKGGVFLDKALDKEWKKNAFAVKIYPWFVFSPFPKNCCATLLMLSGDKISIFVCIFLRANYVSDYLGRYLGDWDEIFSVELPGAVRRAGGAAAEFSGWDSGADKERYLVVPSSKQIKQKLPELRMTFTLTSIDNISTSICFKSSQRRLLFYCNICLFW